MRIVILKHSQNIPMINVRVSQIRDDVTSGAMILLVFAQPRWSCSMSTAELFLVQASIYFKLHVDWPKLSLTATTSAAAGREDLPL
jgi:hypothetical protein